MCGVHVCSYALVLEGAREVGEVVKMSDDRNSEAGNINYLKVVIIIFVLNLAKFWSFNPMCRRGEG